MLRWVKLSWRRLRGARPAVGAKIGTKPFPVGDGVKTKRMSIGEEAGAVVKADGAGYRSGWGGAGEPPIPGIARDIGADRRRRVYRAEWKGVIVGEVGEPATGEFASRISRQQTHRLRRCLRRHSGPMRCARRSEPACAVRKMDGPVPTGRQTVGRRCSARSSTAPTAKAGNSKSEWPRQSSEPWVIRLTAPLPAVSSALAFHPCISRPSAACAGRRGAVNGDSNDAIQRAAR